MVLTYFKRYRMEIELDGPLFACPDLPETYRPVAWSIDLLDAHAETKYRSFIGELDSQVFPCLGDLQGCRRLMGEIVRKDGFLPGATWLIHYRTADTGAGAFCGTIQGIRDQHGVGAVQNLGTVPPHRNVGIGTVLLYHALCGFRAAGLPRAFLEVTAENVGAIRLYQRLGFRNVRTVYKAVEVAYT